MIQLQFAARPSQRSDSSMYQIPSFLSWNPKLWLPKVMKILIWPSNALSFAKHWLLRRNPSLSLSPLTLLCSLSTQRIPLRYGTLSRLQQWDSGKRHLLRSEGTVKEGSSFWEGNKSRSRPTSQPLCLTFPPQWTHEESQPTLKRVMILSIKLRDRSMENRPHLPRP